MRIVSFFTAKLKNKREILITLAISLVLIIGYLFNRFILNPRTTLEETLRVGFVYDGDESIPYTNNFIRAQHKVEELFGDKVEIFTQSNVTPDYVDDALEELIQKKCGIIFTTSYSQEAVAKEFAEKHPDIQFCQACGDNAAQTPVLNNYHTFMGEIYQGRYVSGIVAGLKLRELIENGDIHENEAKVGYIAAYPFPTVISGYTAFFLGVRSVMPEATMTVMYSYSWGNFSVEKANTKKLIDEGCVIISQHSDTIGPAVACEENAEKKVFHIGYNQSMINIAPGTSLVSTRINWNPYITGAVSAVLNNKKIERAVKGHVHGNDLGAGFEQNWVQMLELNSLTVPAGAAEEVAKAVQAFKKGKVPVFQGNYTGVNPYDEEDTYDLRKEFRENASSSAPKFCYVLRDVITVEEDSLF